MNDNNINNNENIINQQENNDIFNTNINNLIVKYNLDKNDPLFALIEIQLNILKEFQNTKQELLNNSNFNKLDISNINSSNIELFNKLNDEFYFLSKEKLSQVEKELNIFLNNIKSTTKQDIDEFKIEIKSDVNDSVLINNITSSNNNKFNIMNFLNFFLLLSIFLTLHIFKN